MLEKQISAIVIVPVLLVVTIFATSCFWSPIWSNPPTATAQISGSVIIANKIESTSYGSSPPSDHVFWIVKLSVKNLAYKYPIEVSSKAFSTGGVWAIGFKNTQYPIQIYAFSQSGNLSVGQSGQFMALFSAPRALNVADVQLIYKGQDSTGTLSLEDKVAAYNWDTKTITATLPSKTHLTLAILFSILLITLRFYPEVRMRRNENRVIESQLRIAKSRFDTILNHPIFGTGIIAVVGVLVYFLYPLIGYQAIIAAFVIASPLLYISVKRILVFIKVRRIEEGKRLEKLRRVQEEQGRIKAERIMQRDAEEKQIQEEQGRIEAKRIMQIITEETQRKNDKILWSRSKLDAHKEHYLLLPARGIGNKGMTTQEFADRSGMQKDEANNMLEMWYSFGRVYRQWNFIRFLWWRI